MSLYLMNDMHPNPASISNNLLELPTPRAKTSVTVVTSRAVIKFWEPYLLFGHDDYRQDQHDDSSTTYKQHCLSHITNCRQESSHYIQKLMNESHFFMN